MTEKFLVISAEEKNVTTIQFLEYVSIQNAWNIFMLYPLPKPFQYVVHSKPEKVKTCFFKNRIKGIYGPILLSVRIFGLKPDT